MWRFYSASAATNINPLTTSDGFLQNVTAVGALLAPKETLIHAAREDVRIHTNQVDCIWYSTGIDPQLSCCHLKTQPDKEKQVIGIIKGGGGGDFITNSCSSQEKWF